MKTKENIHITLSRNLLKKIDENGNNKSEIIEKILSKYFSDLKKSDEITELKTKISEIQNQLIEMKKQIKMTEHYSKFSYNLSNANLKILSTNNEIAAKYYDEIIKNYNEQKQEILNNN